MSNLTCAQVTSLLSSYIENTLNQTLTRFVNAHLEACPKCREKYETLKKIFAGLNEAKEYIYNYDLSEVEKKEIASDKKDFALVQNFSAYVDNELSDDESLRVKKYVITNLSARKTLEDIYKVKNLLNNSFENARQQLKFDYSKLILKKLDINEEIHQSEMNFKVVAALITIFLFFVTGLAIFVST